MARLQRKRFSEPVDVRRFPHGRVDIIELDDTVVGRMSYEPGWRWSVDVKPIATTESCQYHHVGVTLEGRLRVEMPDGTQLEIGVNGHVKVPTGGREKSPPLGRLQAFVDGPPALVLASFIR